jgi:hypothetical protein
MLGLQLQLRTGHLRRPAPRESPIRNVVAWHRFGLVDGVDLALVVHQPGVDAHDLQLAHHHPTRAPLRPGDRAPGSIGCVFAQKRPTHEIGSLRYPKYARHIQLAINFGLPSVLTRTRDEAQMALNRATALSTVAHERLEL